MRLLPQSPPSGGLSQPAHWSRALLAVSLGALASTLSATAAVDMTGAGSYSQNFDTLPNTATAAWTDNTTIASWYAARAAGTTALVGGANGTGSSTSGGLYSFGALDSTDRALGSIGSGSTGTVVYGVLLHNISAGSLTVNSIAYHGEEWRNSIAAAQTVDFAYQVSATAISSLDAPNATPGLWTGVSSAGFTSPVTTGTAGPLDGNASGNFANIAASTSITVPAGSYVMLRWRDIDHSGSDYGLGIDDLTVSWAAAVPPSLTLSLGSTSIIEGGTSVATVTRTGDLTSSLAVDVASSDTTAATVSTPVTIPANSASTTFNVTGFNDLIQDGSQSSNITVSAAGYTSDVKTITVDDDSSDVSLLTINEVCAKALADYNGDGTISNTADEFIEFVNTSGASLDISGWTVSDNNGVTFTFPASTVLVTGQAAVLFGGGTVAPTIGSALAFKATGGTNLNDTGGDLVAVKNGATLIAKMSYSTAVTDPASFNLNGDLIPGPFVLHTAVTGASGNASPGKKVDQSEFINLSPLGLALLPTTISENAGTSTGTVTLPGGALGPATVFLSSSNILKATVPATVDILAGQPSANFTITAIDNIEPDGTTNVTISASAIGYTAAQAVLAVVSDSDPVPAATLAPGSIAFTVFNADGTDDFGFVALVPIAAGTEIRFTDNEWNGQPLATTGVFNTGEGFAKWTAPAGGVPAGTVVVINNASNPLGIYASNVLDPFSGTPYGTVSGSVNLNVTLETLYAYQGTELHASGFLATVANHTGDSVVGTDLTASETVYLPTGARIGAYKGARTTESSFAGYLPLIANTATNWDSQTALVGQSNDTSTDGVTPDAPFNYDVFSVTAGGNTYASWKATNAGGQGAALDFDKDGVSNGVEYFFGATGSSFTPTPQLVANKVTYPKDATATSATGIIETSPDLVTWSPVASDTSVPGFISYQLLPGQGKIFVRLNVVVTP